MLSVPFSKRFETQDPFVLYFGILATVLARAGVAHGLRGLARHAQRGAHRHGHAGPGPQRREMEMGKPGVSAGLSRVCWFVWFVGSLAQGKTKPASAEYNRICFDQTLFAATAAAAAAPRAT